MLIRYTVSYNCSTVTTVCCARLLKWNNRFKSNISLLCYLFVIEINSKYKTILHPYFYI